MFKLILQAAKPITYPIGYIKRSFYIKEYNPIKSSLLAFNTVFNDKKKIEPGTVPGNRNFNTANLPL